MFEKCLRILAKCPTFVDSITKAVLSLFGADFPSSSVVVSDGLLRLGKRGREKLSPHYVWMEAGEGRELGRKQIFFATQRKHFASFRLPLSFILPLRQCDFHLIYFGGRDDRVDYLISAASGAHAQIDLSSQKTLCATIEQPTASRSRGRRCLTCYSSGVARYIEVDLWFPNCLPL